MQSKPYVVSWNTPAGNWRSVTFEHMHEGQREFDRLVRISRRHNLIEVDFQHLWNGVSTPYENWKRAA